MNILVVRNDKLGDFITALPSLYVLKQYSTTNHITVLVAPLNKSLALECDFIDEVIVDDGGSVLALAQKIKDAKIDVSITLFSNTRVAIAQYLARIPKRIAPATKIAQIFYTHRVKQHRSQVQMSEFEYNLELTKELFEDIDFRYKKPLLMFEDAKELFENFKTVHKITKEIVVFHIGFGGSSDANLTKDEYEILIREVVEQNKYQVMMTFGPDESELYEEMKTRLSDVDVVFYLSVDGLVYFAKLISQCKLFVSTSTGTYHIASLVGTPTITFFADSLFASAKRWRGVGEIEKQKHFTLYEDAKQRADVVEKIKRELLLT